MLHNIKIKESKHKYTSNTSSLVKMCLDKIEKEKVTYLE